jgi:hypothetical protein
MMFNLIPLPYRILGAVLIVVTLIGGSVWYGYNKAENKYIAKIASYEAEKELLQTRLDAALADVKVEVVTKYIDVVKTVKEKEYVYRDKIVTVPSKCYLSNGWVYLHDSVARGEDAVTTGTVNDAAAGTQDNSQ